MTHTQGILPHSAPTRDYCQQVNIYSGKISPSTAALAAGSSMQNLGLSLHVGNKPTCHMPSITASSSALAIAPGGVAAPAQKYGTRS